MMKALKMVVPILVLFLGTSLAFADGVTGLVTNGGFETGDLTGWTPGGNTGFTDVGTSNVSLSGGNYVVELGPVGSDGTLSQTLATKSDQTYAISFALHNPSGNTPSDFTAWFDGTKIFSLTDSGVLDWTVYSFIESATSSSTVLQFNFRDDPNFLYLDNVSVFSTAATTPEPSSIFLLGSGLLGLGGIVRRKFCMSA